MFRFIMIKSQKSSYLPDLSNAKKVVRTITRTDNFPLKIN